MDMFRISFLDKYCSNNVFNSERSSFGSSVKRNECLSIFVSSLFSWLWKMSSCHLCLLFFNSTFIQNTRNACRTQVTENFVTRSSRVSGVTRGPQTTSRHSCQWIISLSVFIQTQRMSHIVIVQLYLACVFQLPTLRRPDSLHARQTLFIVCLAFCLVLGLVF